MSSTGTSMPDPLHRLAGLVLEPLERQCQVRATLGLGDGVDLVHDDPVDVGEDLARTRGEHEVERLGRCDQDVGRRAEHRLALLLRRVAGADGHRHVAANAAQRRAQVALDVVGERLQRRDVDESRAGLRGRLRHQAVEAPEECGERLARSSRRREQRVVATRDRRPGLLLSLGRAIEGAREPITNLRSE
jgi:hypothetical protein